MVVSLIEKLYVKHWLVDVDELCRLKIGNFWPPPPHRKVCIVNCLFQHKITEYLTLLYSLCWYTSHTGPLIQRPLGGSSLRMSFEFDLSDRLISGELRRAEELSVGLPRAAGINAPTKIVKQTIRFPDYHEPLDRSVPVLWLIHFWFWK